MANWWGNMSGAQAIQMGQNIFTLAQQQAQQQQEQEAAIQQQKQENFFKKMQLDMQKQRVDLESQRLKWEKEKFGEELGFGKEKAGVGVEQWQKEFGFGKQKHAEEMAFKEKELAQKSILDKLKLQKDMKPDLSLYPSTLEKAMNIYEQTGNWGNVQAVQKYFDMPVEKKPSKIEDVKEVINTWKAMEGQGFDLKVDRKPWKFGGVELALPQDIILKYGADSLDAMKQIRPILENKEYGKYSVEQLYDLYFRAKRFLSSGRTRKEIENKLTEAGLPDNLVGELVNALR